MTLIESNLIKKELYNNSVLIKALEIRNQKLVKLIDEHKQTEVLSRLRGNILAKM